MEDFLIPDLNRCHFGDVVDILPAWPDAFVQTVVSSPPYLWLRDYGLPPTAWPEIEYIPMAGLPPVRVLAQEACLGWESSPADFVGHIVHIFRQVRRVLRDDGTLWFNMGDSYAGSWGAQGRQGKTGEMASRSAFAERQIAAAAKRESGTGSMKRAPGLKEKDLIGVPWRCAYALLADGWYLRNDLIWHKPNPSPESVSDRCTKAHEYLFLFSKSERYFYDIDAIREKTGRESTPEEYAAIKAAGTWQSGGVTQHAGTVKDAPRVTNPLGRNKRSVWTIASFPYEEAHYATFPPKLIQPCILAGTPAGGCCPACRRPWEMQETQIPRTVGEAYAEGAPAPTTKMEWVQACACPPAPPIPSIVFDPFLGSGTVGEQAQAYGRSWIGCEMNASNDDLQTKRTQQIGLI
jgi:hypothetical protein